MFSRSDDNTNPHSLFFDVIMLPIFIENVDLVVTQENYRLKTFQSLYFELKSRKQVFEVPMTS